MLTKTDLFISGEDGYNTYRIPALAVTNKGTVLAFCEGRKNSRLDSGDIDILLKRSFDGGTSWEETQLVVDNGKDVAGNPAPVVDRHTGIIHLLFCKNLAEGSETEICKGKAPRTVWVTRSKDYGKTWSQPEEITSDVKKSNWTWYATGPCHGIQLKSGRLVIPCDHIVGENLDRQTDPYHSHVIYSDDRGQSWKIGGIVDKNTNEATVVETVAGDLYINCRQKVKNKRAYAWSHDQGESFGELKWADTLIEPQCQGNLVRFTAEEKDDKNRILFSNPGSTEREKLTVRVSYDECNSWNQGQVLHEGPAAYSDLCRLSDMKAACLYECGQEHSYEKLTFARFDREWLGK